MCPSICWSKANPWPDDADTVLDEKERFARMEKLVQRVMGNSSALFRSHLLLCARAFFIEVVHSRTATDPLLKYDQRLSQILQFPDTWVRRRVVAGGGLCVRAMLSFFEPAV